jgi:hypothetical protein
MNKSASETSEIALNPEEQNLVFNYLILRLFVGLIAFVLPPVVVIITARITSSISASYHTLARDFFVGFLFVIGALLWAYNGHRPDLSEEQVSDFWKRLDQFWNGAAKFRVAELKVEERVISAIGGFAAVGAALFPTACDTCAIDATARVHITSAVILFSTIAYFCLVGFAAQVKNANAAEVKKKRRARVYSFCGWGIVVAMIGLMVTQVALPLTARNAWPFTFVAETIALWLFGFSWMTASKVFSWLADEDEQLKMSLPGQKDAGQGVLDQAQAA